MVRRPSVLAVTSEVPWPLNSGGHLRTFHLLRTLAQRFEVRLVVPTRGGDEAGRAALEHAGITLRLIPVPPRTRLSEAIKVGASAARREPYVMFARHRSGAVARGLAAEAGARRADVLYLDHLDSLVYAGTVPDAPIVIDLHNVYSRLAAARGARCRAACADLHDREAGCSRGVNCRRTQAHTILAVSERPPAIFPRSGRPRVSCERGSTVRLEGASPRGPGAHDLVVGASIGSERTAHGARDERLAAVRTRVRTRECDCRQNPPREVMALAQAANARRRKRARACVLTRELLRADEGAAGRG